MTTMHQTPTILAVTVHRRSRRSPLAGLAFVLLTCFALGSGAACDQGTSVYLNEQIFRLPATTASVGCTLYELNDHGRPGSFTSESGCGPGASGACFGMKYSSLGNVVMIDISDNGQVVAQKRYDEAFFRSGRVDEFTLQAASGLAERFRYWGGFDASGQPICDARPE